MLDVFTAISSPLVAQVKPDVWPTRARQQVTNWHPVDERKARDQQQQQQQDNSRKSSKVQQSKPSNKSLIMSTARRWSLVWLALSLACITSGKSTCDFCKEATCWGRKRRPLRRPPKTTRRENIKACKSAPTGCRWRPAADLRELWRRVCCNQSRSVRNLHLLCQEHCHLRASSR